MWRPVSGALIAVAPARSRGGRCSFSEIASRPLERRNSSRRRTTYTMYAMRGLRKTLQDGGAEALQPRRRRRRRHAVASGDRIALAVPGSLYFGSAGHLGQLLYCPRHFLIFFFFFLHAPFLLWYSPSLVSRSFRFAVFQCDRLLSASVFRTNHFVE